jgi:hypothetical protein
MNLLVRNPAAQESDGYSHHSPLEPILSRPLFRLWAEKDRLHHTEHPNALPTPWRLSLILSVKVFGMDATAWTMSGDVKAPVQHAQAAF